MSKPGLTFPFRLLRWFCPDHLYEEIEGDLIQKFNRDRIALGEKGARKKLWWNAVCFLRPEILLRNKFSISQSNLFMLSSYYKTTSRHLAKNKLNFVFKLTGLTFALFSLLIIFIYLSFQLSYDTFHGENVYRVNSLRNENGNMVRYATVPPAIGPAFQERFSEIESCARMAIPNRVVIQYQQKLLRFTGFAEADSSIFDVLKFDFIKGNKHALDQPGSVVLTKSTASQIFGEEDPIGKVISSPDHQHKILTVTGIIDDYAMNSHLKITALHTFGALMPVDLDSWEVNWDGSVFLYARLREGTDIEALAARSKPFLQQNLTTTEEGREKNFDIQFQPIQTIYLGKVLKMDFVKKGNSLYVYFFGILGFFLLLIAIINYVNLSIADFTSRLQELGVRKILGARKRQIIFQIGFESVLFSISALFLAIVFLYLFFPQIASRLEPALTFSMLLNYQVIIMIMTSLVIMVTVTTFYPALKITNQQSADTLKPNDAKRTFSTGNVLLGVQYGVSILCVCATAIIGKQLSFVQSRDLGYDRSHVISLVMPDEYPGEKVAVLKNELKQLAGVESVSYSYYLMPISTYFKGWYQVERNGSLEPVLLNEMFVDHDYFETMGIELTSGRAFDMNRSSDRETAFIINETAVKELGWENPIGKRIKQGHSSDSTVTEGTIVGVVKDFNSLSLHKKIEPVILRLQYDSWPGNSLNIKVAGSPHAMLPELVRAYEKLMPGFLADARILTDVYHKQYESEQKAFLSLQSGSWVIVIISALGILSLSLFMSVRRMKEFGIRKVLGASTPQISGLHTWHFIKIALVANIVALPIAYLVMKQWLNSFVYQTGLSILLFISIALGSLLVVALSSAYASYKSGMMNPVDVLKS